TRGVWLRGVGVAVHRRPGVEACDWRHGVLGASPGATPIRPPRRGAAHACAAHAGCLQLAGATTRRILNSRATVPPRRPSLAECRVRLLVHGALASAGERIQRL